jgi:Putative auto-transporter adhesin, head GIN domain
MKQKFALITLVLITLVTLNSFAQNPKNQMLASLPLVADENGITSITVSDNVSVILMQDSPENVGAKATTYVISKLSVSLVDGNLFLGTARELAPGERLTVFVRVNELRDLTLKGNALVVSDGILQSNSLHISAAKEAKLSIKSRGKFWFDAPVSYDVEKEKGYFMVNGM